MSLILERPIGFWAVKFSEKISPAEEKTYQDLLMALTTHIKEKQYNAMKQRVMACILAVAAWQNLSIAYPEFQFTSVGFVFDHQVKDAFGYDESGQLMLGIHKNGFQTTLYMDVAGYLFGFEYHNMPIVVGTPNTTNKAFSHIYTNKLQQPLQLKLYLPKK